MNNDITRGQVIQSAAEIYDTFFLPALFEEWPERVLTAARVEPGHKVLDVACGTGVLALAAAEKVGERGDVVGLDINDGMLSVARKKSATIDWRSGQAESLPFPDQTFDIVTCQFGLMFFDDRHTAIREMMRVLRPGGRLAVAVWDTLENTPGYAAITKLLQRLFGDQAADAIRAPYNLGEVHVLKTLFSDAGVSDVMIETHIGEARFPSLDLWMYTDVKGWTLANILDDVQFELLRTEAAKELNAFVGEQGRVAFLAPAHIVIAAK